MTGRDKFPFGKHGPKREGGALTLQEVKDQYPDYLEWLLKQEGFQEKNKELTSWIKNGDAATARPAEVKNIEVETILLASVSTSFKTWWARSYGERLRRDGEVLYIAHLRVAIEAWTAASKQLAEVASANPVGTIADLRAKSPPLKPTPDDEINF